MKNKFYNYIAKYKNMSVVAKASLWFLVCNILQRGLSVITTPLFTRLLTTEEYGLINSYSAWMSIISIFTGFKLNYGVYNKGMSKFPERKNEYNASMQFITTIFTLVFAFIYFILKNRINSFTGLSTILMICMIVQLIFDPAVSFWSLHERYDFKYRKVVILTLILSLLNPLINFFAILVCTNNSGVVKIVSSVIVTVIFGIIIFIVNIKRSKVLYDIELIKFAILFNLPLIPHYLSEYVLDQSDRIMIQKICSQAALGLYSVAYNAGMVLKILVSSINSALLPWLYRKMSDKEYDYINKMVIKVFIILAVSLCTFILVAPEIVYILAAKQYMEAIYVIPPVTVTVLFIFLFGIYGNIEFYYDKNMFTMYVSFGAAILNFILNWMFIPIFGYIAAAYTTLFGYIILCLSHMFFMERVAFNKTSRYIFKEKIIWIICIFCIIFEFCASLLYKMYIIRYIFLFAIIIACWKFRKIMISVFEQMK